MVQENVSGHRGEVVLLSDGPWSVCVMDYQHWGSVMLKVCYLPGFFVSSPSLLTLGAECVVQPVSSLGGALCIEISAGCEQAQAWKLCCPAAWQVLGSMLGEEDAAENDPDVRFRSFSFRGSGCVLHFLILILFGFIVLHVFLRCFCTVGRCPSEYLTLLLFFEVDTNM